MKKKKKTNNPNKRVVEELEASFALNAGMWCTTSSLLRDTGYCPTLSLPDVFREETLI